MGELAERLAEDQAGVGGERVDPPAAGLAAEGEVVLVGQVAAEAEPEAPLAGGRAVAGAHVAAGLAEGGDHVAAEAHRRRLLHPLDLDRRLDLDAPPPGHDRGRAVAPGHDLPLGRDDGDLGIEAGPVEHPGQVADRAVGVGRRDDQLPRGAPARQRSRRPARSPPRPELRSEPRPGRRRRMAAPSTPGRPAERQAQDRAVRRAFIDRSWSSRRDGRRVAPLPRTGRRRRSRPIGCRDPSPLLNLDNQRQQLARSFKQSQTISGLEGRAMDDGRQALDLHCGRATT